MSPSGVYLRNATRMWRSLEPSQASESAALFRAEFPGFVRMIALAPGAVEPPAGRPFTYEDAFGPPVDGVDRLPIMVRPPGAAPAPPAARAAEVRSAADLAVAERVMIDGFPLRRYQPLRTGTALPPRVLELPGWRVWLAYCDGVPAAGAYTYDDGESNGVYWVATLPEHRGHGLGRAVMTAAIAVAPERPHSLVATDVGRPLYESVGFTEVGQVNWHSRG
ncbi:GNAT family N-acetyltransferase [Actinoplanes bogorensis]|uniref:GNAT family N-acetyltransferase n=1 Tax=Paractinoplanes bogorensis TaxID=1610840 RepID=A0ABS5YPJ8_9ACTN|nr:GNAT family N-acetyltransferase [Actinoplanes bogorensis]MBU2665377.1 GNAT family N-acetyltransferase [Actinoplanes bogorensis]